METSEKNEEYDEKFMVVDEIENDAIPGLHFTIQTQSSFGLWEIGTL